MSIKPVDMQFTYNKLPEASKVRADEVSKHLTNIQTDEKAAKEKSEEKTRIVKGQDESQKVDIKKNEKKERDEMSRKKKNKKKKDIADENDNNKFKNRPQSGGFIDVKL